MRTTKAVRRARAVAETIVRWREMQYLEDFLAIPSRFTARREWIERHLEAPRRYKALNDLYRTTPNPVLAMQRAAMVAGLQNLPASTGPIQIIEAGGLKGAA